MAKEAKEKKGKDKAASTGVEIPSGKRAAVGKDYKARLGEEYRKRVVPALMKKFSYKNIMQVPKIEKVVINMGVGMATQEPKLLDAAVNDLLIITGQKPTIRKAKKAISNFKLREGVGIACFVTLRRAAMYEFLDRLINIAVPRIRDFKGVPDKSFDGRGNYTLGVKEQIIFPEIDVDKMDRVRGMDITIVTSAKTDEEAYELLKEFGMPFKKK
ncbi:MAG TPA: 50S ribosomal protein L5 [bacterium]|nr:50S ribosomal protein L5 [bacterium]HMW32392.1 50S ribosomal protein L5 [bacterium]HMW36741.1 50S ribosomal protein L5 [bacterium]HMY37083.1 50S ribosomal protein L5 [bacterium]HMZ04447.1 50S ribosomal protein L5 [bacterium]